jgi:hypothetical protein
MMAGIPGNMAVLARDRQDWPGAEALAREALALCETVGSQGLIAENCYHLARALVQQGKKADALPYARRSVEIFTRLGHPDLEGARGILTECES